MSPQNNQYGFAVDVGTSTLLVNLVDIINQQIIDEASCRNPQRNIGEDIITRVRYASLSSSHLMKLAAAVRHAIWSLMQSLLTDSMLTSSHITLVVICGNTVMQRLFLDLPVESLLSPPYRIPSFSSNYVDAQTLDLNLTCSVFAPPTVQSFIGSDALAVLLSAGIHQTHEPTVVIDVGTNTEISISDGTNIWMASAPSGPAFEGMSIACGIPAQDDAINSLVIDDDFKVRWSTIVGTARPRGICGSGSISLLAELRRKDIINELGSFRRGMQIPLLDSSSVPVRFVIADKTESVTGASLYLSQIDIRMLQQSKAAIRGTLEILLKTAGLTPSDIRRVYLTGAFGTGLHLEDAYDIGMFPVFDHAVIEQRTGGAILGATMLLLDPALRMKIDHIANDVHYLELMGNTEFEEIMARSQIFARL